MPAAPSPPDGSLLTLLRGVSRSFYLSMRLLPAPMRQPVAVGYLLARTSDTIADAPGWPPAQRLEMLERFDETVRGRLAPAPFPAAGATEAERDLLAAFPRAVAWLNALDGADREDVVTVLWHITHGQRLDIERFGDATAEQPKSLAADHELDEYTYLVAGCVGEFWTRLGFRHVPRFASLPLAQMLELGRRYGQALQLVNVLRDAPADRAQGRGYLPDPTNTGPWLAQAKAGLECGMRYALALHSARLRAASALPALIGVQTLALLRAAPTQRVKVPRREVRALLWRVALSLGSRACIEREFRRWDNPPR